MRIGFVSPEYVTESYFSGGLANFLHRTSLALVSRGHEVHVFTRSDRADEDFSNDGVHVHRVAPGALRRFLVHATSGRLEEAADWIDFSVRAWRRVALVDRTSAFDVLQHPNYSACGLVASLLLPIPYAVRLSTYGPAWNDLAGIPRSADRAVGEWLEALQLKVAKHVYAPSRSVRRMAMDEGRLAKVDILPTPFFLEPRETDTSLYDERFRGRRYLLFFGRYQLHKGFHVLAQALESVLEALPDCSAAFVGMDLPSPLSGSMREYAERLAGAHRDRTIFAGETPHERLYPVIAGARLVVLPSLADNLPNACLEAMACGRPVIGTNGASFEELIADGRTGFLVPTGNPAALAAKIREVWNRDDLDAIGEAARERVRELHPERTVPLLERYFRDVIADG